jgi:hypothetical protein
VIRSRGERGEIGGVRRSGCGEGGGGSPSLFLRYWRLDERQDGRPNASAYHSQSVDSSIHRISYR